MNFNLFDRTIFLTLSGSRAYGFHTESSDYDYRGVVIPPLDSYLGISPRFEHMVDGSDGKKTVWKHYPSGLVMPEADMQVMELTKFARLAAQCNPSVIEILFSNDQAIVHKLPVMQKLIDKRQMFLSKQAKARFCGYALSQLQRIKRHKRWLDKPPTVQPKRSDFGLPEYKLLSLDQLGAAEALIKKEVDSFMIDQTELHEHVKIELASGLGRMIRAVWVALNQEEYPVGEGRRFTSTDDAVFEVVARDQQFSENFIEVLKAERKYRAAKQEWDSYQHWLKERNPARAEIEKKYGYDCKHAAHLVRLIRMCREILETGQVLVWRPDAQEIKGIRNGDRKYEWVVDYAEQEDAALQEVAKKSSLPNAPPMNIIHETVFEMVMEFSLEKCAVGEQDKIREVIHSLLVEPYINLSDK